MKRKSLCVLLCTIIAASLFLTGCTGSIDPSAPTGESITASEISIPYLNITPVAASKITGVHFTSDQLGGNFTEGLSYHSFSDVSITLDGTSIKLDEALQTGVITDTDIFYFARLDAENGLCRQTMESIHGLTNFFFQYPEYNLQIIYDILETPSGTQRLISHMSIHSTDAEISPYYIFREDRNGIRYDVEDWGLSFSVGTVSSSSLNLNCSQYGGQQIGQLEIISYDLSNAEGMVSRINGTENDPATLADGIITMGGNTELTINWEEYYGELSSGEYILELWVKDQFDSSTVHPLMEDYYDLWCYGVAFSIP